MSHGGKRNGAGRPKGSKGSRTIEVEAVRQYIIDEVVKQKEQLISALIKQALAGETQALKVLLDRTIGKVQEEPNATEEPQELIVNIMHLSDARDKKMEVLEIKSEPNLLERFEAIVKSQNL